MFAIPAGGGNVITKTHIGYFNDTTARTTYTFVDKSIGVATASRKVIAVINAEDDAGGRTISSATIGGNAATISVQTTSTSRSVIAGIIELDVPTGTTATFTITFSGAMNCCGIDIYTLDGAAGATAAATATDIVETGLDLSASITTYTGGVIIAGHSGTHNTSGSTSVTWTNITADSDYDVQAGLSRGANASIETQSGTATVTCTEVYAFGANQRALVVGSWAPR